ncbi:MAG: hypothetical protein Ct9H300mP25_09940 [Acidobacteriota bacterium]|nr:MAG: hypothetical protein Ct9H300mP25_09940 [Acidobacteriota bacterium]
MEPYRDRLREAEQQTGMHEAAISGEARLDGRPLVLISLEFDFLGGTMGSVVGEKVARAFQVATRRNFLSSLFSRAGVPESRKACSH